MLSIAAAQGNVETIRQLLDCGLDETHRDNAGWTPLHYAHSPTSELGSSMQLPLNGIDDHRSHNTSRT